MNGDRQGVIPSRTEGEGPRHCQWARLVVSVTLFAVGRSLIVRATRDDKSDARTPRHALP